MDNNSNEGNANKHVPGSEASAFDREGHAPGSRPLTSLFSDLARDASRLVSKEAELAKAEVSENTSQAVSGVVFIVVSAAVLLAGLVILLEGVTYIVAQFLPPDLVPWLAAIIVGGVVTLIGIILLAKGRSNLKAKNLIPDRTIDSVQRDGELAREHTR
ncbi:MAG: phage holin family protein [Marinobacter sp.]